MRFTHARRLLLSVALVVLTASACSSDDDAAADDEQTSVTTSTEGDVSESANSESDDTASDESEDSEATEESDSESAGLTCDEAGEPSLLIRGANGWLPQMSADTADLAGDYDAVLAAIETLRPIQDIEGIFGTMKEGLDNMEADLIAAQEGRYDDMVGDYNIPGMNAVIGEEVCG